jgi:curved DNA-binding protein CbpA
MKDYYYILGIKENSSLEEIKKAYRKLSLKFHPDKNYGDEFFAERFKEIQEAYETLSKKNKRNEYDYNYSSNHSHKEKSGYNFNPSIEYFKSNKTSIKYGEEITFSWKALNADRVIIKPFGLVSPIGEKTYKIKNFRNESIVFELTARNTNINRETKQTIHLNNLTYKELYNHFKNRIESETKRNEKRTYEKSKNNSSNKVIKEFKTDKGVINISLDFEHAIPTIKNEVFQNGNLAKDGKYKLGFMNYILFKEGISIDLPSF